MAVSQSILERVYGQLETDFGIIPNATGVATLSGADYMRHTRCTINAQQDRIDSSDKTGTISATIGAPGARGGNWALDWEVRPSGVAGTAPDFDSVLQATFGQAPTVVASTSVTYNLSSVIKSLSLFRFRQPSTMLQQCSLGSVVQELAIAFEQQANIRFNANGTSLWVADTKNWSTLDTTAKGGLTNFPAEPGSPAYSGTPVNSLAGSGTIDGSTSFQIRNLAVRIQPGIVVPRDRLFAGQYGSSPERDILGVYCDLSVFDEDTVAMNALYTKALAGTPINLVFVGGSVAGSRVEIGLRNCLLPFPGLSDDARKWASNLQNIRAYPTTLSSLDECYLKFF